MSNNTQSRKWTIVINNPLDAGLDHAAIVEILQRFSPDYFCLCDEIAKTGTFHTHGAIYSHSPIRWSTLKNRLPIAHIEKAYGSMSDNRAYILKEGKWAGTDKAETSVLNSFQEWGILPDEKKEINPEMSELIDEINAGKTTAEIIKNNPKLALRVNGIDILRQTLLSERYASTNRDIDVTYMFGATGSGKTRSIFSAHNARDICRITHYGNGQNVNFDAYNGQSVIVFEEFHSQIAVGDMLNYLDTYPLMLPARYADKVACYTIVYITSNFPLEQQYESVQHYQPETWKAFIRRINRIIEFLPDGTTVDHTKKEYVL